MYLHGGMDWKFRSEPQFRIDLSILGISLFGVEYRSYSYICVTLFGIYIQVDL